MAKNGTTAAATENATDDGPGNIYRQIPRVMEAIGAIGKDRDAGKDGGPKYAFRGIDDMYNAIQPAMIKHGIFVVPAVEAITREQRATQRGGMINYTILTVRFTFYAGDGSSIEAVTIGEAMDSSDKSSNKAMSAAMKYAFIQVFAIPTEGNNDTENEHIETEYIPTRVEQLRDLMEQVTVPKSLTGAWLRKAGVDSFEKMSDEQLDKCIALLRSKLPENRPAD